MQDKMRAKQIDSNNRSADMAQELRRLRAELAIAYQTRDTLGLFLRSFWASTLWRFMRPAWIAARALGRLDRGIEHLIPLTNIHRARDGTWHGNTLPHF